MADIAETTTVLLERELVIYRRERSNVWQCRFKVDGIWQRASTKERDLGKAKQAADRLRIAAEIRKHENLPVVTRKFKDVAKLAIKRMEDENAAGKGKASYEDYIRAINNHLIPFLGKLSITNITYDVIAEFDEWRELKLGKAPSHTTLLMHNAALNRVFDEAVSRNYLTDVNRPKLEAKGKVGDRRAAFEMKEMHALRGNFDAWIELAKDDKSKELRTLLRDYVDVLLDTGARPGKELMGLKWKQISFEMDPTLTQTDVASNDAEGDEEKIELADLKRKCFMPVTGKRGTHEIMGRQLTVAAFERIIQRNYSIKNPITDPFKGVAIATNNDYVFRTKDKKAPTSFQRMFENYLADHSLLMDPKTEQKRVFYSLRHTYATFELTNDEVPIHTVATQMGTSVTMIEKHYSHLTVSKARKQLEGKETRRLLLMGGDIDEIYANKNVGKMKAAKK